MHGWYGLIGANLLSVCLRDSACLLPTATEQRGTHVYVREGEVSGELVVRSSVGRGVCHNQLLLASHFPLPP